MPLSVSQEDFLSRNRISEEDWSKADIPWDTLKAIADDHISRHLELSETAALCARVMQSLPGVHSVRWRIKDVEHLLEKIVRKRAAESSRQKYEAIGAHNYFEIVTDLVGLRALHLFKDECFEIDSALRRAFVIHDTEPPVAYVREGDPEELSERFEGAGLSVKPHPAGYRSVHYVVASRPLHRRILAEVQVRTIFEEGWSEIDHRIRYPNFSDDPQVGYFLRIFNRLAGSADEMGTFVQQLVKVLEDVRSQAAAASLNYEQTLQKLEETIVQLDAEKSNTKQASETMAKLKKEVKDLRRAAEKATAARHGPAMGLTAAELARHGIGAFANEHLTASIIDEMNRVRIGLTTQSYLDQVQAPNHIRLGDTLAKVVMPSGPTGTSNAPKGGE